MQLLQLITLFSASAMILNRRAFGETLPVCYAKRLPLEGIQISCDLHRTNKPLYCDFCVIYNGTRSSERFGEVTYDRPRHDDAETCKSVYFPKHTGSYRFDVDIAGLKVFTNDVIYHLPALHVQHTCQDRLLVNCSGRWFLEVPFIKIFIADQEVKELTIRSEKLPGSNDTIFVEAVAEIVSMEADPLNVRCEALYFIQSYSRHIANNITVQKGSSHNIVFLTKDGRYISDNITITHGLTRELKCTVEGPSLHLSLLCSQPNVIMQGVNMKSQIHFNISWSADLQSTLCVCFFDLTNACGKKEITIYFDLPLTESFSAESGRTDVPDIKGTSVSVNENSSSHSTLKEKAPQRLHITVNYAIAAGVLILVYIPVLVIASYNIYHYWKEHSDYGNSRSASSSPQQSNEYASIKHSPQSSNSESTPHENSALLDSSSSYGNSEKSGSSQSNPYISPDDVESSSVSIQTH
uniref:ZP domain-containing protein n=1 Tax=Biomphalaria glabrata TaxID=6526 RepID=A0A2C9LUE6_BIOGL